MTAATVFMATGIGGLDVPDAGPVFFTALGFHVAAGATAIVAGATAAFSVKRPGRHPRAGTVYLYGIATVFATATVMAAIRWRQDWHLFVIAAITFTLATLGWWARRRQPHRWMVWHGTAMAGSYIGLLTGFYVDNGPQLPVWDRLPHLAYWLLPAAIGIPLTWRALVHNGALSQRLPAASRIAVRPRRRS
ncbi:MAG: DUF2306 domain-containing protein [Geodermatophilaceae bacterium]|nr:DUF2306 domain-containing protein [Geodermatophilaceae bacterium]